MTVGCRVTVGILSWNRKDALRVALESVRRQTIFPATEVVVVDNCSADGTREMLRREYPWVRLVERQTNSGLAEGRNILVRLARAPVVFWMDDDCELVEDNCLELLVEQIETHPDYAVVFARILEGDDGPPHAFPPKDVPRERFQMQPALPATFASGGTCVRREQFLDIGGYDGDFFRMTVEHAYSYKVFNAESLICYYPKATIIHRPHSFGRNYRTISFYSTRNKLLGIWRYMPAHVALVYTIFELTGRLTHNLRSPSRLAGFLQGVAALVRKLPRCLLRERRPMGRAAFARWGYARHYLIRSTDEFHRLPDHYPFWKFVTMDAKLALMRRLGRPRTNPFWQVSENGRSADASPEVEPAAAEVDTSERESIRAAGENEPSQAAADSPAVEPLQAGGLRYLWHSGAFLTRAEAEYALGQLWRLCAGSADWQGEPLLEFPAIGRGHVDAMHRLPAGELPQVPLKDVAAGGRAVVLDTDRLPALGALSATGLFHYDGQGPFPLDLVAATFLALTRWEEVHWVKERDEHGRMRATDSLAWRQGFHDRPVIDEWALVVRGWVEALRAGWRAAPAEFRVTMTHDLDRVLRFKSLKWVVRGAFGELIARSKSPRLALRELRLGWDGLRDADKDRYVIATRAQMDFEERLGIRGAYYFMTARPGFRDPGYDLSHPRFRWMLEEIQRRGHEVGWHPGYRAAECEETFAAEKRRMDEILGYTNYGGRHHFLRWQAGQSWDLWETHGLSYDSTVGWANAVGFRCGTCHPFPCFSLTRQVTCTLHEHPLLIMDGALQVVASHEEASFQATKLLLERAKQVQGSAVLLTHNRNCPPVVQAGIYRAAEEML